MSDYSRNDASQDKEIWKDIPECGGDYEASSLGRIRSARYNRILKPWVFGKGYLQVSLGKKKRRSVHRLILEAFVGPCPEGMECRHLDGDPKNNRLENLCWGTPQEQHVDRTKHGKGAAETVRKGEDCTHSKLTEEDIMVIRSLYARGRVTQKELARRFGLHQVTISEIVTRKIWKHVP